MRYEIKCVGFGGQGIALMGRILGVAASIENTPALKSVFTQSYGPESRGGASSANVVVETTPDMDIEYPYVIEKQIDFMIVMSQEGYDKYIDHLKEGATIFVDPDMVDIDDRIDFAGNVFEVPATRIAEQNAGRRIVANIVMLGFVSNHLNIIDQDAILRAMLSRVPPKFKELNQKAFNLGMEYKKELIH